MFSIEHGFDASTVTLIDDGPENPLKEDVVIHVFDDHISIEQWDPRTDRINKITLSLTQANDLGMALDLPEGVYQLKEMG